MNADYALFFGLYLACLVIRTGYELLKRAGKLNPKNVFIFGVIFTVMCLMWASWFSLCPLDPFALGLPDIIRWIGLAAFVAGFGLAITGMVQLRGMENIDHLVTTGLYARIRHPMYAGFILWILGWALFHDAPASLAIGLVGIANILFWRGLEEHDLASRYGETYLQYRKTTWF